MVHDGRKIWRIAKTGESGTKHLMVGALAQPTAAPRNFGET